MQRCQVFNRAAADSHGAAEWDMKVASFVASFRGLYSTMYCLYLISVVMYG